ncbi:MAG TPA: hypothetical protein VJ919_14735 [Tangfeifania sp.]|nr:hypothetical protein [Tangfeifania sp.]
MNKAKNRPALLSALCILTFIGSGVAFLGYFAASLFFDQTKEIIVEYSSMHSAEGLSPLYFTALMALYALSLTGAIRMWKLHRDGLFLYIIAQLIIMFLPVIFIDWSAFSTTNAIFTTVFIIGYSINIRHLK